VAAQKSHICLTIASGQESPGSPGGPLNSSHQLRDEIFDKIPLPTIQLADSRRSSLHFLFIAPTPPSTSLLRSCSSIFLQFPSNSFFASFSHRSPFLFFLKKRKLKQERQNCRLGNLRFVLLARLLPSVNDYRSFIKLFV
jgi:hypothetical protein